MKVEVTWDAASQEFHEVEVRSPLTVRQRERRRRQIASMIVDEGMTVRQIADVLGIHNANVYRAVAGMAGGKFSDIPPAWAENKRLAGPRAHATMRLRQTRQDHSGEDMPNRPVLHPENSGGVAHGE